VSKAPEKEKRSLLGRALDRVPVLGGARRVRGWFRRRKGLVYLALAVVVIFIVRPVLTILAEFLKFLRPLVQILFDNPVGRLVFYNLLAIVLLYWVWRKARAGILRAFGLRAMRHFLDGMHRMILGKWNAAMPCFEKVYRISRWIRLEDVVPEHPDIAVDAQLKIAACLLETGRPNEAKAWLLRIRPSEIVTPHVRRAWAELRALSYESSDELETETVLNELEKTREGDRRNRRVLAALRDRLEATGDLERTRTVARELVTASSGTDRESAERDLALIEFRLAHKALGAGDAKGLKRALKAQPGDVRSALLLGDLAVENDDVRGALKAWSRAVSLPVFDRIAALLEQGKLSGDKERKLLLDQFPYAGTLLVLAEYYRKRGEYRKARSALEKVAETTGENFTLLHLYASCLSGEGDSDRAAELYRRALSLSFQ
jgi:tetratricopeptide (TPR) repeat protein